MTATNGQKPELVIDLEKLAEPYGVVRVSDEETFPIKRFDSFSYFEQRGLAAQWNRIIAIEIADAVSEADAAEYERTGRAIFDSIVRMPKKKAAALSTAQIMDVVGRFFGVQLRRGRVRTPQLATLLSTLTSEPLPSASTDDGPGQEAPTNG